MNEGDARRSLLYGIVITVAVGFIFYTLRPVILPLVLAIFFGLLVRPAHLWLRRFVPNAISLTLMLLGVGLLLIAIPLVFAANIQAIAEKVPEYAPRIHAIIADVEAFIASTLDVDISELHLLGDASVDSLLDVLTASVQGAASFLGTVVLVLFTMLFVLTEADVFRDKLTVALNPENEARVMNSAHSMRELLTQYVVVKTLISALSGIACGLFTWALGIDFPFVWAVLTFMLYFIPNFGSMVAAVPPVLLALIQFETPTRAIVTLISLVVSFNLIGNVLEPRLMGRTLKLSPLVVFLSLLFWGWFWGFVGVILSIPLTVAAKVIFDHFEGLRPLAILLGDDPEEYRSRATSDPDDPPAPTARDEDAPAAT